MYLQELHFLPGVVRYSCALDDNVINPAYLATKHLVEEDLSSVWRLGKPSVQEQDEKGHY